MSRLVHYSVLRPAFLELLGGVLLFRFIPIGNRILGGNLFISSIHWHLTSCTTIVDWRLGMHGRTHYVPRSAAFVIYLAYALEEPSSMCHVSAGFGDVMLRYSGSGQREDFIER